MRRLALSFLVVTSLAAGIAIGASHRTAPVQPAGPLHITYTVGYVTSANATALSVQLVVTSDPTEYRETMLLRYGENGEFGVAMEVGRAPVIADAVDDAIMAAVQRQDLTRTVPMPAVPGRVVRVTGSTRGIAIQAIPAPDESHLPQPEVRLSVESAEQLIQILRRAAGNMEWISDRALDLRRDPQRMLEQQRRLGRPRGHGA